MNQVPGFNKGFLYDCFSFKILSTDLAVKINKLECYLVRGFCANSSFNAGPIILTKEESVAFAMCKARGYSSRKIHQ